MKKAADRVIRSAAPMAPIKLGERTRRQGSSRSRFALVVFMRVVALLWMVEGLAQWAAVAATSGLDDLQALSTQRLAMTIFFCVLDLIAAQRVTTVNLVPTMASLL
ncbi:MAG: hypothetical protein INR70_29470, partial [Parafilimonas terrae]|nr:hypothetical protein [Parafilimonas terrae]